MEPKGICINTAYRKNGVAFRDGIHRLEQDQKSSGDRRTLRPDNYSILEMGKRPRIVGAAKYRHR